jgi:hypothetical protein
MRKFACFSKLLLYFDEALCKTRKNTALKTVKYLG